MMKEILGFWSLLFIFLLGGLILLLTLGCSGELPEGYRPLNEDEQLILDVQLRCFGDLGYDTSSLPPVLVKYVEETPCKIDNAAGCTWRTDDKSVYTVEFLEQYVYRDVGQYPDSVPTDLNVELFMHEFLHYITDALGLDWSHEGIWFQPNSLCPQDIWRDEWVE